MYMGGSKGQVSYNYHIAITRNTSGVLYCNIASRANNIWRRECVTYYRAV